MGRGIAASVDVGRGLGLGELGDGEPRTGQNDAGKRMGPGFETAQTQTVEAEPGTDAG